MSRASKLDDLIKAIAKKTEKKAGSTASSVERKLPSRAVSDEEAEVLEDILTPSMKRDIVDPNAPLPRDPNLPVESMSRPLVRTGQDVIETTARDVTPLALPPGASPSAVPWYKDPKKLSILGLTGAGLAGTALMMNGEESPPIAPPQPASQPVESPVIKKIQAKLATPKKTSLPVEHVKSQEIKPASGDEILSAKTGESVVEPSVPELDIGEQQTNALEALKEAQRSRDQDVAFNELGKISERTAAAIGGFKPIYGDVYQGRIDRAGQHVEDVKEKMRLEENDPKSPTSKAFKAYIEKFSGMKIKGDLDAQTGKTLLPVAYKQFEDKITKEARVEQAKLDKQFKEEEAEKTRQHQKFINQQNINASKENARTAAEAKKTEKEQRREETQDKWISQRYDKIIASKPYQSYSKISNAKSLVDEAVKNPSGFGDLASLYSAVTALDPDSVVREGEIKLSREAASLWGNISTGLSKLGSNPRIIPDDLLKDMNKYISNIHRLSKEQYHRSIGPVVEQAKSRGIPDERFIEIDPMYGQDKPAKEQQKDPKIEQWAKQYGKDYATAEKILKSRGYSGK